MSLNKQYKIELSKKADNLLNIYIMDIIYVKDMLKSIAIWLKLQNKMNVVLHLKEIN